MDKLSEYSNELERQVMQDTKEVHSFLAELDRELAEARRAIDYGTNALTNPHALLKPKSCKVDWDQVYEKALERDVDVCSICITSLNCKMDQSNTRKVTLLSCTHVFHSNCISSMEKYDLTDQHVCPICRSQYERINWSF